MPKPPHPSTSVRVRCASGFSVIELLVAMTLLALVLASVYQVLGQGSRLAGQAEGYSRAALHAESKLASLGIEEPLAEGITDGEFDEAYRWTQEVLPYEIPEDLMPQGESSTELFQVRLVITWGGDARPREAQFFTLRTHVPEDERR
ncbi:MAG: prepilin-type N-terminal cleavage/methylation domain-containing protein [Pseudomonadota bacterium]